MLHRYGAFIGGEPEPSSIGTTILGDPSTGAEIAAVSRCGPSQVETAVAAAQARAERWAQTSPERRSQVLVQLAERVRSGAGRLASLEVRAGGKPARQARAEVIAAADAFAEAAATAVSGEPGVWAAITASTFPLRFAAAGIGEALAAGRCVVLKPAEETPLSTLVLAELAVTAGVPPGVVNVVTGRGAEAGQPLAAHPGVELVLFSGSAEVGGRVVAVAGAGRTRLEVTRRPPPRIAADGDFADIGPRLVWEAFANAGQDHAAAGAVHVLADRLDEAAAALGAAVGSLRVGPAGDEETDVGPLLTAERLARAETLIAAAIGGGATIVTGGRALEGPGHFFAPTVAVVEPGAVVQRDPPMAPALFVVPW